MAKWRCEICGNEFENFHAQGFDNKIYCPLCYFKKENQELKEKLDKYENPEDMTLFAMWCTEKVKEENERLKKKYENSVSDYETTMFEKEQLNILVNSCQEEIIQLKKQVEEKEKKYIPGEYATNEFIKEFDENILLKNHQKEFIEYMTKTIEELECEDVDDEEMKGYLIQRIDTFKEILQKYKNIIGDDKNKFTSDYIDNHNVKR